MDYEKAYKDALARAKEYNFDGAKQVIKDLITYIFPELKESDDERIRKGIIKFLIDVNNGVYTKSELEIASWIAWLEKQCSDISSFPESQRKYMEKYISLDKVTLIKLLAERDINVEECINSFEEQVNQKWNEEMKFRKFDIITNSKIEYEIRDIQKNQLGDWVYILYNANVARLSSNDSHLPDGSIRWVCKQVDEQFELKQRLEKQQ